MKKNNINHVIEVSLVSESTIMNNTKSFIMIEWGGKVESNLSKTRRFSLQLLTSESNQSAKSTDVFFFAQVVNVLRHEVITVYLHCCLAE